MRDRRQSATERTPNQMKTLDRQFQYSYVKSPCQIFGTMTPFRPHFSVQHLSSGEQETFNTRQGMFEWIGEWYDICDSVKPHWLLKEINKVKSKL